MNTLEGRTDFVLSIAIYSDQIDSLEELKLFIQDYLIATKTIAKVSVFNTAYELLTVPQSFDVYFFDMDTKDDVIDLSQKMMKIDTDRCYVFSSVNTSIAHLAARARASYFIEKPYNKYEIDEILTETKKNIKEDNFIIKTPEGERRVRVKDLNYINIVKRCLCYHLKDGNMFDGQTLRSSFEKAIHPLEEHKSFLFLPPSLLINVSEIKILDTNHITFENDEILYTPKKAYDTIREAWTTYNKI